MIEAGFSACFLDGEELEENCYWFDKGLILKF